MKLKTAMEISKQWDVHYFGEVIYNIIINAGNLFAINNYTFEIKELMDEYLSARRHEGVTDNTPLSEAYDKLVNTKLKADNNAKGFWKPL